MTLPIVVFASLAATLLLYWLLVWTEGVFLGRRVVVWLYDLTANKYDRIKEFNYEDERFCIVLPLLRVLRHLPEPLILDVATGTGRIPQLLQQETDFEGSIIGLDASTKMLDRARAKLLPDLDSPMDHMMLVQQLVVPLPFKSGSFDAVTCLESLEFFPSDIDALAEMKRVLKPGGFLLVSRRKGREGKLFFTRFRDASNFESLLRQIGFAHVRSGLWQVNYDMVFAWKRR